MARETLYAGGNTEKFLTEGNIDLIKSELPDVLVSILNGIISSRLVHESVAGLDTVVRTGLARASVSKLDVIVNVSIR